MGALLIRTDEYTRLENEMVNTIVADVFIEENRGEYVKVSTDLLDQMLTETGWTKKDPEPDADPE